MSRFLLRLLVVCLSFVFSSPGIARSEVGFKATGRGTLAREVYSTVSPAVVGVTCRVDRNFYFGTGALIDPSGLVLTSATVAPRGAARIEVYLSGGRVARGRLLMADAAKEISLVRIRSLARLTDAGRGLPHLKLGDSRDVALGDPVFTVGNSFRSIQQDDQVCLAAGVVSGLFRLREKHPESQYLGPAIETSAALNSGVDGGPLVNERGEIIGLLSLNFSRNRWLGTAVPINELKPLIAGHRGWFEDSGNAPRGSSRGYLGVELEEIFSREIRVLRLKRGGPAYQAGLKAGDRIVAFNGEELESMADFLRLFQESGPGKTVRFSIERQGETRELDITLWGRF